MKNENTATAERKNSGYLTFISVAAAFAVLTLHTNGCFWHFSATESYWKSANVIESVFYFAVPLFFMISGCTLMDFYDRYSLKEYFIKRAQKTLIPFLAWNFIGIAWKLVTGQVQLADITLKNVYQGITGSEYISIYWFFTSLFIIYLCIPLFASVEKSKRKQVFSYLVLAGLVLNGLFPFIKSVTGSELNTPLSVPAVSNELIWPLIGWLLHNCELKKQHKTVIYVLAAAGLIMHICGTYFLSMEAGEVVRTYKGYNNLPSILYSTGVFVLLREIGTRLMKRDGFCRAIQWLGQYTFAIYLMQFPFLELGNNFINTKSIIYRLGAPFVIIPIIIGITWCMRKIPVIKRIVP